MPYRLWHYAVKLSGLLFIGGAIGLIGAKRSAIATTIGAISLVLLFLLGFTGAWLGLLMVNGRLRMRCPFCGKSGPAWGSKSEGIRMQCPDCWLIWSGGKFGLEIFRERLPDRPAGPGLDE